MLRFIGRLARIPAQGDSPLYGCVEVLVVVIDQSLSTGYIGSQHGKLCSDRVDQFRGGIRDMPKRQLHWVPIRTDGLFKWPMTTAESADLGFFIRTKHDMRLGKGLDEVSMLLNKMFNRRVMLYLSMQLIS